jgi:hypothetical protein
MSDMNEGAPLQGVDQALVAVDATRRETLRKLILGAAFVVPVVASFSVDALVSRAHAVPNITYSGKHASG